MPFNACPCFALAGLPTNLFSQHAVTTAMHAECTHCMCMLVVMTACFDAGRSENTKGAERQLKFLVYNLEAACRAADQAGEV